MCLVIVADDTEEADEDQGCVPTKYPGGTGVLRHVEANSSEAMAPDRERGVNIPMVVEEWSSNQVYCHKVSR